MSTGNLESYLPVRRTVLRQLSPEPLPRGTHCSCGACLSAPISPGASGRAGSRGRHSGGRARLEGGQSAAVRLLGRSSGDLFWC